ncbi:MAG: GMC family oxidoreductase [Desulfobacteraceae bacterium]|nr:GMC family oxidoreductase [Desulfobacteraceae bacterium]MBC2757132.1 GMC family oxidoreductase [Desulfobacteraceae bacterium]
METLKNEFDAIVIGSGPGGATVARELSQHGKKVLILEWGPNKPLKGSFLQMFQDCFILGKSMFMTKNFLAMVRGITTGGSSRYYCALACDPPVERLKKYGVDITPEIEEIKNIVPCEPLRDDLMSQAAKVFMDSALDLGYDCQKANKYIFQDKCHKDCDLCLYGCPHDAKWSAVNFVDDALEYGAEMINKAKVTKIIVENNKAIGVEYRHKKKTIKAYASKVILAAGGIGSPVILRESGIEGVGHNFFFDPLWFIWGKVDRVTSGKGVPMCSRIILEDEGIVLTDHNMPHLVKAIFDFQGFKPGKAFSFSHMVPLQAKVRDGLSGHIGKSGWVWKGLMDEDKKKLNAGFDHAKKILDNAGAEKIYKSPLLAAHPGGTVKIGEFLDTDLKTEYDNLYVCDASVIPHEMGLPPSLTILTLGKRLSKHLLGQDKAA